MRFFSVTECESRNGKLPRPPSARTSISRPWPERRGSGPQTPEPTEPVRASGHHKVERARRCSCHLPDSRKRQPPAYGSPEIPKRRELFPERPPPPNIATPPT